MHEFDEPIINFDLFPAELKGPIVSVVRQISNFLGEYPPNIVASTNILNELKNYLINAGMHEKGGIGQDTIRVIQDWIDFYSKNQLNQEKQKLRATKLKEIDDYWTSVDVNDAFQVIGYRYHPDPNEIDETLKGKLNQSYKSLLYKFHPDRCDHILDGEDDELKQELNYIIKLLNLARDWLFNWIENGKPQYERFNGFSREERVKYHPDHKPKKVEYDSELNEILYEDLVVGDYIHVRTKNSYYIFRINDINNAQASVECVYESSKRHMVGTTGMSSDIVLKTGDPFYYGFSNTSRINKIILSKNSTPKPSLLTEQKPAVSYDQRLNKIVLKDLVVGDYIHLRTMNSYYVFKIDKLVDETALLKCVLTTNRPMLSATGWSVQKQIVLDDNFKVRGFQTSSIRFMEVSKYSEAKSGFFDSSHEKVYY